MFLRNISLRTRKGSTTLRLYDRGEGLEPQRAVHWPHVRGLLSWPCPADIHRPLLVISGELLEKGFPLPACDLAPFTRFSHVWGLDHVEAISVNGICLRLIMDHNVESQHGKLATFP